MKDDTTHPAVRDVVVATRVITSRPSPSRARGIVLLLAGSVALMMIGFGIILPVFGRRLGEFGSGVEALGLMTMAFALAQLMAGPFMGSLADRIGRRPLILISLVGFSAANVGFLFAPSAGVLIALRAVEGLVTAGMFPAAMGVVADIFPEEKRSQWVGIVMGSYGAGFIFGPVIGGLLYDSWGFAVPFVASAVLAFVAFVAATVLVPETRTRGMRRREELRQQQTPGPAPARSTPYWASLPRPVYVFLALLVVDFSLIFAFTFIEPQLVFYVYEDLQWTTAQFGLVVGMYGLAMVLGQAGLGRVSDRFGRMPVIVLGVLLTSSLYFGLVFIRSFPLLMLIAGVAGLGVALATPALSGLYLAISEERHRSRVLGLKQSAAALGGVAGPLLVVAVGGWGTPQVIFGSAGAVMGLTALLAFVGLRRRRRVAVETEDLAWELGRRRALAAQTSLRGIVVRAITARSRAV